MEAVRNLDSPQFIMFFSNKTQFGENIKTLEKMYPSIGCIEMRYDKKMMGNKVNIVAFSERVIAVVNVLE